MKKLAPPTTMVSVRFTQEDLAAIDTIAATESIRAPHGNYSRSSIIVGAVKQWLVARETRHIGGELHRPVGGATPPVPVDTEDESLDRSHGG